MDSISGAVNVKEAASVNDNVSLPSPPSIVSEPPEALKLVNVATRIVSLPAPAEILSIPPAPVICSAPVPPVIISLPAPAEIVSAPAPPSIVSAAAPVVIVSANAPPITFKNSVAVLLLAASVKLSPLVNVVG